VYRVAVPWVIWPHQIVIEPARANRVLTGDLFVQPTGQDERRLIRRDFQQHNLTADAAPPSDPLSLPASPFESIHVVLDQPVDGMATVQLRFPAWQVTFLSDGLTPYTVAWGRYAAASVAPDLSKLVRQSTHDIQNNALELVLSEMMEAGGEEKRMTPTRLPWKKWLLWACLLLGVLITAWMAYSTLHIVRTVYNLPLFNRFGGARMPAPTSIDLRITIQELLQCGMTHESISDDLCIPRATVTKISGHIKKHGHIYPIRPPGNNPTLTEDDYPIIKKIVLDNPDLTLDEYAEIISQKTNKKLMSTSTICRVLKKLDLRRKKKSKYAEERDREDVKKKRRLL
jgi:transposase